MAVDEKSFADSHEITRITCQSNTQISPKATNIISTLSKAKDSESAKPALVIIVAQSRWANKLISIVEIAKRDLESKGVKVFQYNALSSEIVEIERKPKPKGLGATAQDGEASEDDAFQTIGAAEEGGLKKRAVPVMTTYLATQPVKALRMEFG
jgi:hypothetical protein